MPGPSPHVGQHLGRLHQPPPRNPDLLRGGIWGWAGRDPPGASLVQGEELTCQDRDSPTLQDGRQQHPAFPSRFSTALGFGSADVFLFLQRQSSRDTSMLLPLFPTNLLYFAALFPTTHMAPSSGSNCSSPFGIAVTAKGSEQQNIPPWGSRAQRDQSEICEHAVSEKLSSSEKQSTFFYFAPRQCRK